MNNNKKNLKKLIAEWDKKLKASGFVDIEDRKTGLLKKSGGDEVWAINSFENLSGNWLEDTVYLKIKGVEFDGKGYSTFVWKQSQAEYYRLAAIYYHDKTFESERERTIWGLHAEGVSSREIARRLNLTQRQVFYTIQSIEKRFGLLKNDK